MSVENASTPSRPLPRVRIEQPSAERGADDVRAHLDEPGCALCGVPDAPRVLVEIPWTGTRDSGESAAATQNTPTPGYASKTNPTEYRFCEACGTAAALTPDGVCRSCFDGTEAAQ